MRKMFRNSFLLLGFLVLLFGVVACGSDEEAPGVEELLEIVTDSPETAAREWLEAIINADGATLIARTCSQEHENVQNLGLIRSLAGMAGEEVAGDKGSGSIEGLNLDVLENDGQTAHVRVHGEVISSVLALGIAQEIDETWIMVKEDDQWKYCGPISGDSASGSAGEPAAGLIHEWTIPTGDIDYLTVAENGNIYGLIRGVAPYRHVAISPAGETTKVVELEEIETDLHQEARPFSSVQTLTDGTFVIGEKNPLLISPEGEQSLFIVPEFVDNTKRLNVSNYGDNRASLYISSDEDAPRVDDESTGSFYYYHIDKDSGPVQDKRVPLPNSSDYSFLNVGAGNNGKRLTSFIAYIDEVQEKFVLINSDGEIVYNEHPEGIDMSRYTNYQYYLSPWGDLWLAYNVLDEIGVDKGRAVLRIDLEGNVSSFESYPQDNFYLKGIQYLPNRDEIYYVGTDDNYFGQVDRDFNLMKKFSYAEGTGIPGRFVGFDGNLYTWNKRENLLSKYTKPE